MALRIVGFQRIQLLSELVGRIGGEGQRFFIA